MSEDPPRFTTNGPELRPDIRWIGWVLLLAVAILALVVGLGLRGEATAQAMLPSDPSGTQAPATKVQTVTVSCAGPGHGITAPPTDGFYKYADVDTVSEGSYFAGVDADLVVGRACEQVRQQRVTHALELGLLGLALGALGAGIATVGRRRPDPA